ncbi:ArnT family glycosyltransferase [Nakamurella lactea]|uniref:ArnT family glycosyltransferase n=1 Tax=Nakamurella lactea TaxID=459515 RepID=UPI0004128613|nr:glycosyltransferase family 39 protein [Nakamurella lactea]
MSAITVRTEPDSSPTAADRLNRFVIAAPDRIVFAFLAACLPIGAAVAFRVFHPALVIPAALIAIVVFWHWTPSRYLDSDGPFPGSAAGTAGGKRVRRAAAGAVIAGILVLFWMWINRTYTAEYVVLQRDPGIYTLRAMWLQHHASPLIDVSQAQAAVAGVPGAIADSLGFPTVGTNVEPQSNGLVPGLLGAAGWVGGLTAILKGDLVIGGIALLAVYGFARRLLGPLWALVPMAALAASMPFVSVSRSPYSEPTALLATFGALTLLWTAWESGKWSRFFVAGLLFGVSSLARIDGGATVIGILGGFALVTAFARSSAVRRSTALYATAFFVGSALMIGLSIIDGVRNSFPYFKASSDETIPLNILAVVAWLIVVALAFIPLGRLRDRIAGSKSFARVFGAVSLAIGLVLILRPLFWTGFWRRGTATEHVTDGMQAAAGMPVEPGRTYDESTVNWLAMYQGWLVVVLAGVGAALLAVRVIRRRDPRLVLFVMAIAAVSLLYLNKVSIFPDQIWAMRRFVPVVIPGLLIAATWTAREIARKVPAISWAGVGLGVAVVGMSVATWTSVWTVANAAGQVDEMNRSCAAVGDRPVVLAGKRSGSAWFEMTFTIGCGVPTVGYVDATQEGLAKIRANYGRDVAVVVFDPKAVTWKGGTVPKPYQTTTLHSWEQPLQRVPDQGRSAERQMWIGTVDPNGIVTALPPAQK